MPQNDLSIQLEDLLLALETYTKKIDKQLIDSSNLHHAHYKQAQDIANWAKALTSLLKTYQNKETLLQTEFVEAINKEIATVFKTNEDNYHKRIDEGFTKHITDAGDNFLEKTKQINDDLDALNRSVTDVAGSIDDANDQITRQTVATSKQMLDNVKREFNRQLIITLVVMVIVVLALASGAAWLFIPSKSEIAQRRSDYQYLEKVGVAHNIVKVSGQNGHYARIDPKDCFEDEKSLFYSKSKLCKFK
jgi:CHASE3 domain sensor protein